MEALPLLEAEAKERKGGRPMKGEKPRPKLDEVSGRSDTQVAKAFHTSRGYVAEAKALKGKSPDTFEAVKRGPAGRRWPERLWQRWSGWGGRRGRWKNI